MLLEIPRTSGQTRLLLLPTCAVLVEGCSIALISLPLIGTQLRCRGDLCDRICNFARLPHIPFSLRLLIKHRQESSRSSAETERHGISLALSRASLV